jgi:peptide/nickel transport system permease protein
MGSSIRVSSTAQVDGVFRRPKFLTGATIVLLLIVVGVFGPVIAPHDPNQQALRSTLRAPDGSTFLFGTDSLGRDVLSRILYGARVSLIIAAAVVVISGCVGIILGIVSGFIGGWVDLAIQKLVEVIWAFPALLLALVILTFLGQGLNNLIIALVIQRWISYCRVVRAQTLSLREREFVLAARLIGAPTSRILRAHVLPNVVASCVVVATFSMAGAIIAEASLSFLGLGVPTTIPTWGTMLADGRTYVTTAPWLDIFPGSAIFITVLGINLLGDGLRDAIDPRLNQRVG